MQKKKNKRMEEGNAI
jgi:hypothetical protein